MDRTYFIAREDLLGVGFSPKATRQFEEMQLVQANVADAVSSNVAATEKLADATFITLSANAELPNERVLTLGAGLAFVVSDDEVKIDTTGLVQASGGHVITFVGAGESEVLVPLTGILATRANAETLENKTLKAPKASGLTNAADDTAAAAAGVPVGGVYRNGSALQVRVA